ncbi:Phosphatidate cytidylyltransferase [Tenacibaculum litopenaei]|jgi:phosphatidate cytidylyltransferase|uniref:phosphatidate cytidylyltransferase n=1 Tax=Tenacibaculum litopenaei TaxID=396016 RepID=UPI0038958383
MQNLLKRSISALIYAVLFISATLYSEASYTVLMAVFAAVCLWEFNKIIKFDSYIPFLILPVAVYYSKHFITYNVSLFALVITLLCSVRLIFHLYAKGSAYPNSFTDKLDLNLRYIIFPFCFLMLLPVINNSYHPWILLYIVILIWTNDSFAYIVGKNLGKNKLFESVSPKKTIEGFVGGVVFACIAAVTISYFSNLFSLVHWLIIAVIVGIFGTVGDLVESKFKRQANVKDSGTIMPGHGGLLDRLDSLFFLAPFVYLYIHFVM